MAALTRGYARNFETSDQIARAVAQLALYDLPDDYYSQFVPRVESLTPGGGHAPRRRAIWIPPG